MGFWGKLGKGLLKVAPIAAGFIPGVGPLASMAIGGLAGAASKKLSGGSWGDALKSGALGAATSYGGAQAAKGLGPSASILDKIKSGATTAMGGNAGTGRIGNIMGMANQALGMIPQGQQSQQGGIGPSRVPPMNEQIAAPRAPTVRTPNLMDSITRGRRMVNPNYQPAY